MILEYQQFREIADQLKDREAAQSAVYGRADAATELAELGAADPAEEGRRATLGDLLKAFAAVMEEAARDRVHRLEPIGVTIEDKVRFIRGRLHFTRPDGAAAPNNPYGSMLYVYNGNVDSARAAFGRLGKTVEIK